jgi:hypothetical protein
MALLSWSLVIGGIALAAGGLPAAHRLHGPYDILAALAVLIGVIIGLCGTLLVMVPNFLKG